MQGKRKEPDFLTQLKTIDQEIEGLKAKREKILEDKRSHDAVLLSEFMSRNRISMDDLQLIMTSGLPGEAVAASKGSKTSKV